MISNAPHVEDYKGFLIADLSDGVIEDENKDKITVFLVDKSDIRAYFSFYNVIANSPTVQSTKIDILKRAVERIKEFIDGGLVHNYGIYTFEFRDGSLRQVEEPKWWEKIARDFKF